MKELISYLPNRAYPSVVIDKKQGLYGFENCKNRWVSLSSNEPTHAQSIRNMWKLVTTDMRNSSQSIIIEENDIVHEMFYKDGYICQLLTRPETAWLIGGRPMSVHHLFHCIENRCGLDKARSAIKMEMREVKAWNRAKSSHYLWR